MRAPLFRPVRTFAEVFARIGLIITVACGVGCANPPPSRAAFPFSFAATLEQAMPGVVGVYGVDADDETGFDARGPFGTVGAGFVVDESGTIVTAAHVTIGARRILVRLSDQRVVLAVLVGEDAELDIAILRIDAPGLQPLRFGRAAALRAGDWVLAIGEPYGLNGSAVAGIVGGGTRHFGEDMEGLFIQSSTSLNPGNSGGPLLDLTGAVVGMNVRAVVGAQSAGGVSLSIPIELVMQIVRELGTDTAARRPRLGARFEDVSPPAAVAAGRTDTMGALVCEVPDQSLASQAGFHVGDILVGMNDRPVVHSADLARLLFAWRHAPGTRFVVVRSGRFHVLQVPSR